MRLSTEDIIVRGGDVGWRLHDYVIARLELRAFNAFAAFAVVTLGDIGTSDSSQMHTNVFNLTEISGCQALRQAWKEAHARDRCEQGFLEYFLRSLWANRDPHLEFLVEDGRATKFTLTFDRSVRLIGRCPEDTDILGSYFGVMLAQTD